MLTAKHSRLLKRVKEIVAEGGSRRERLDEVSRLLARHFPHFDWVGFYLVDPTKNRELVLGPYVGDPTEHTRIAFGEGICGQAANTKMTFVVKDVAQETNYLSCSPDVQSEIVVPIFKEDDVIAELDIDSHTLDAFSEEDRSFLEKVCEILTKVF